MDDADLSSSPVFFLIIGGIALVLFFYLYQSTRKKLDRASAPRRILSYECVVTPVAKADAELRAKFPALSTINSDADIELVRFGLFNWGELNLSESQVEKPVTVEFSAQSQVLSAELSETIKTDFTLPEPLKVDGNKVVFPKFGITARGTLIFNFIVRGSGNPEAVVGEIEGGVPIRRLS